MNKKLLFLLLPIFVGSFFYLKPQFEISKSSKEAILPLGNEDHILATSKNESECHDSFVFYEEKISNNPEFFSLRFRNVHLKIEEEIYRLRFFYDDGDEGEVPTYQVFIEDEQEYADLIETTKLKPGPKYESLLKAKTEKLYEESALLNEQSDEFIHLENKKVLKIISEKSECIRN